MFSYHYIHQWSIVRETVNKNILEINCSSLLMLLAADIRIYIYIYIYIYIMQNRLIDNEFLII